MGSPPGGSDKNRLLAGGRPGLGPGTLALEAALCQLTPARGQELLPCPLAGLFGGRRGFFGLYPQVFFAAGCCQVATCPTGRTSRRWTGRDSGSRWDQS